MSGDKISEANIGEAVRYLHFHDYHNDLLLIGTFSGNVFAWNNSSKSGSQPKLITRVSKTVTSIRNSYGYVKIN